MRRCTTYYRVTRQGGTQAEQIQLRTPDLFQAEEVWRFYGKRETYTIWRLYRVTCGETGATAQALLGIYRYGVPVARHGIDAPDRFEGECGCGSDSPRLPF